MRLARLRLSNFRCFGPEPTTIEFDQVTALLGSNGSGKTAVLQALARLFGTTQPSRTLAADDFHVPHGQRRESVASREVVIEAHLEFPSLSEEAAARETPADGVEAPVGQVVDSLDPTVPAFFEQMAVTREDGMLYCRIRLTGTWTRTALADGTVETELEWLRSVADEPPDDLRSAVSPLDRDRIRVHYVPASRDATRHVSTGPGGLLQQLLRAIEWEEETRAAVRAAGDQLRTAFEGHRAVARLNDSSALHWEGLYDEWLYRRPSLRIAARQIEETIRSAHIVFGPSHEGGDHALERLSDGQQSLFYFAFLGTLLDIQHESYLAQHGQAVATSGAAIGGTGIENGRSVPDVTGAATPRGENGAEPTDRAETNPADAPQGSGFSYERLKPAALTLLAIEEPENHLAPHYLGRIVARLTGIVERGSAQLVLASHAPAVLGRIEPGAVRHLRCDPTTHQAEVRRLVLPSVRTEADRYIREAVRAFPELYFARAVVLCEGDSEEVLIPRFARVLGTDLDLAFVSVVPLGGRHVNHFWRLLTGLGIPFVTLLDLDCERGTGGWARIKYVVTQLQAFLDPAEGARLLAGPPATGDTLASDAQVVALAKRDVVTDGSRLLAWVEHLRSFGVFFSAPLDLDFMMLEAFETAYRGTADGGTPRLDAAEATVSVLGKGASGVSYAAAQRELFPWYNYLFLGRGKPSTHTAAWISLDTDEVRGKVPEPIHALFAHVRASLARHAAQPMASVMSEAHGVDGILDALTTDHGVPFIPIPVSGVATTSPVDDRDATSPLTLPSDGPITGGAAADDVPLLVS